MMQRELADDQVVGIGLVGEAQHARRLAADRDLAVARLLSHRMLVMKDGEVIEQGLTDRVLDDPAKAYAQRRVSSVLAA